MVSRGGMIQQCAYLCIYGGKKYLKSILASWHVAIVTPKIREKGILNIKALQEISTD